MLKVISLGAGVQSTTLALMAAHGEIEMPDCAIFADTGWEPKATYAHLDRLRDALPFPIHIVRAGNLREEALSGISARAKRFTPVPWFTINADGSYGLGKRECTAHYKLEPIQRKIVKFSGGRRKKGGTELWLGISTDEAHRMKPSRVQYIIARWPLIELGISRRDCRAWLARRGWEVPKSSCIGCPLHSDEQWMSLPPDEFADAVEVDRAIRDTGTSGSQFMHPQRVPLDQVDFSRRDPKRQPDLFGEECEGMCGV